MDEENSSKKANRPVRSTRPPPTSYQRNHTRASTSPSITVAQSQSAFNERQPLLRRQSLGPRDEPNDANTTGPIAGGTVLGIHNLAIVMPQFLVSPEVYIL